MKKILSLLIFIACFSVAAFADIRLPDTPKPTPSPKTQKSIDANLQIRLDGNAKEAKLIIPKSQLAQLRAALDEAENGGETAAAATVLTRTQTIASGAFLSLAIVFGGVWLARSRGKTAGAASKAVAAGALLFLLASAAPIVWANVGPPPQLRSISSELFDKKAFRGWSQASGKVKVEIKDANGMIELIVPDGETEK